MTDIFISYRSEDSARVKPPVDALVAEPPVKVSA